MKANYHTHTTFCDGKNTPEETVLSAIGKNMAAIGFSGHAYAPYCTYGMKDTAGYIKEVLRLRELYGDKIQIYLGIEEDSRAPSNRADFDYIIGSSHYFYKDGSYYPIDSSYDCFKKCIDIWGGDVLSLVEDYYGHFCSYIIKRKPDIIGHFDLITKFDELEVSLLLKNQEYNRIAEKYTEIALLSGCIFEVNTGAIARGYRTSPYPYENLLYAIKKNGGKVMLSSDSHSKETLDFAFDEARSLLLDIGFRESYVLYNGQFTALPL